MSTPTDSTAPSRSSAPRSDAYLPPPAVATALSVTDIQEAVVTIISDDAASSERCPVCEAERLGVHCVDCGHVFQDERLRLRPLIQRGISRVFDLDHGLLHTFLELFRHPGAVAKDYASGIRRPYVNPFTYFVLAAAVQVIGMRVMWDPMSRALSKSAGTISEEQNIYFYVFGENWAQEYIELTLNFMAEAYTVMSFVFFAIPLAVALRLLMGKRSINLAEGIVLSLYTAGHMLLLTSTAIWTLAFTDTIWYQQAVISTIMIGWTMYAIVSYFGRSTRTFVTGGIALVLAFLCFFLAITIGMFVNMVVAVGVEQFIQAFQDMAAHS